MIFFKWCLGIRWDEKKSKPLLNVFISTNHPCYYSVVQDSVTSIAQLRHKYLNKSPPFMFESCNTKWSHTLLLFLWNGRITWQSFLWCVITGSPMLSNNPGCTLEGLTSYCYVLHLPYWNLDSLDPACLFLWIF